MKKQNDLLNTKVQPKIVHNDPQLSIADNNAILALYKRLAPESGNREVDISLIYNEAFPVFKEQLGEKDFKKLIRYFGIGCKPSKLITEIEIILIINKIRTIENATYYVKGYREGINQIAKLFNNAPQNMDNLTKAKIIRMYFYLFNFGHYLPEDLLYSPDFTTAVPFEKMVNINTKKDVTPEILLDFYEKVLINIEKYSILYENVTYELSQITNRKVFNKILDFSELRKVILSDELITLESINKSSTLLTYKDVRNLKLIISPVPSCNLQWLFSSIINIADTKANWLILMYKKLKYDNFNNLPEKKSPCVTWDKYKSNINIDNNFPYKVITDDSIKYNDQTIRFFTSSKTEADRLIFATENAAKHNIPCISIEDNTKKENLSIYLGIFRYLEENSFIFENTPGDAYIKAIVHVKNKYSDSVENFSTYFNQELPNDWIVEKVGIMCDLIPEILDIIPEHSINEIVEEPVHSDTSSLEIKSDESIISDKTAENENCSDNPEKSQENVKSEKLEEETYPAIEKFAKECQYTKEISNLLAKNVLLNGNEDLFNSYLNDELSLKKLKNKIGFSEEFSDMFFDLKNIDIGELERELISFKRSSENKAAKKNPLLIKLYCYVVENELACGKKNRVPKRNKKLKISNLLALI